MLFICLESTFEENLHRTQGKSLATKDGESEVHDKRYFLKVQNWSN